MSRQDRETPLPLQYAASLQGLSISELRIEAKRGRLAVWKVGGQLWTSLGEIERMRARQSGQDHRKPVLFANSNFCSLSDRCEIDSDAAGRA